jgi:hypothetical protein
MSEDGKMNPGTNKSHGHLMHKKHILFKTKILNRTEHRVKTPGAHCI